MKKWIGMIALLGISLLGGCSGEGTVGINSNYKYENAEIYIDGDLMGNMPLGPYIITLSEGKHEIELIKSVSDPDKYDQYYAKKTILVANKSKQAIFISLKGRQTLKYKAEWKAKQRKKVKFQKQQIERQAASCDETIKYFKINGNGTVIDKITGLMWKQCSEGLSGEKCDNGTLIKLNWYKSLQHAEALNFAGYGDWRVPTKKELLSIVQKTCKPAMINHTVFPAFMSDWFWSASPDAGNVTSAWVVGFSYGVDYTDDKSVNGYVHLVRGRWWSY